MKKLLLGASLLVGIAGANAQVFSETFDTEIPSTWTIVDVDGLTSTSSQAAWASWAWRSPGIAASSSWYDNAGTGPTNDWLITPAITIPATGQYRLTFNGASFEGPNYAEEYEVLLSTTGTDVANFTTNLLTVTDEEDDSNGGTNHVILFDAALAGQTIHIAFHHTSSDESLLLIDNVVVEEALAFDAILQSVDFSGVVPAGDVNVTGTVKNNGANPITSLNVSYDDGSGVVNGTVTVNIAPGATASFTHPTPYAITGGNSATLNVCATITGDLNTANDCGSTSINAADGNGTKLALMELFTSSTCPPCYSLNYSGYNGSGLNSGLAGLNANKEEGANIAAIKYQVNWPGNGDHAYNPEIGARVGFYGPGGAPAAYLDGTESQMNPTTVAAAQANSAYVDINATYNISGNNISVTAEVSPFITGNAVLHIALLEKEYAAGTDASFSNGETEFHHVMRKMLPNASGTSLSLVNGTAQSVTETYTRTVNAGFPTQGSYDFHAGTDLEVVVFVEDITTKTVYNAAIAKNDGTGSGPGNAGLEDEAFNFGVSAFPNPSNGVSQILVQNANDATVAVTVVNTQGQVVFNNSADVLAGNNTFNLDLTNEANGVYFAKVSVNNVVKTIKINVSK